tara:strand:+ start:2023 stop:2325 length:303 start_codon:yes stop_codon:yes gene_type:complete
MHYIIGEQFDVPPVVRGKTDPRTLELNRLSRQFTAPGSYSIFYIRKLHKKAKIQYTFVNEDTGDRHTIDFDTATEADALIAKFKGDSLPDYEDYYASISS